VRFEVLMVMSMKMGEKGELSKAVWKRESARYTEINKQVPERISALTFPVHSNMLTCEGAHTYCIVRWLLKELYDSAMNWKQTLEQAMVSCIIPSDLLNFMISKFP
jgi:hypothetical protein